VTDADGALAGEFPELIFATVVNVYAVPARKPLIVHAPDAPVTVHVAPPGVAVTSYDVGVGKPAGAVTVTVASSSPTTTVAAPGVFGAVTLGRTVTDAEGVLADELPELVFAMVVNVYAVPAVRPVMVQNPDAPVTVHILPPGDEVTSYDVGVCPLVEGVTVIIASSSPTTTVGTPGEFGMRT
jgi:hypothetical protein